MLNNKTNILILISISLIIIYFMTNKTIEKETNNIICNDPGYKCP